MKRSWTRSASATAARSAVVVVIPFVTRRELVDEPAHPHPALDRRRVLERVLGVEDPALRPRQLPLLRRQPALGTVEQLSELPVPARDTRDGEGSALPEVVVVDLGDGGAEPVLQLRLGGLDVLPLPLE